MHPCPACSTCCILTSRQKDGHFIPLTRGNIRVISSIVRGHIDTCVWRVLCTEVTVPKNEGNDANLFEKISIFLPRKIIKIFNALKNFPLFKNIRFILGHLRSNACSYFFHFCICHANFGFFLRPWSIDKCENEQIL